MLFGKPPEIQVAEDISKKNQPRELQRLQKFKSFTGPAYL